MSRKVFLTGLAMLGAGMAWGFSPGAASPWSSALRQDTCPDPCPNQKAGDEFIDIIQNPAAPPQTCHFTHPPFPMECAASSVSITCPAFVDIARIHACETGTGGAHGHCCVARPVNKDRVPNQCECGVEDGVVTATCVPVPLKPLKKNVGIVNSNQTVSCHKPPKGSN